MRALTEVFKQTGSPAVRLRILGNLAGLYRDYPDWSGSWSGQNPLAGQFPSKTKDWSPEGMNAVLAGLALGLSDRDRKSVARRSPVLARRVASQPLNLSYDQPS